MIQGLTAEDELQSHGYQCARGRGQQIVDIRVRRVSCEHSMLVAVVRARAQTLQMYATFYTIDQRFAVFVKFQYLKIVTKIS